MASDRNNDELNTNLGHWLRRLKPAKVRSIDSSDEPTIIAVPGGRVRWQFVIENVHARQWVRLEGLNKSGDVIGVFENPDDERPTTRDIAPAGREGNEERVLGLMLRAQELALKYRDAETKELLKAMGEMLRANVEATRQLQNIYSMQVDAAAEAAALQATAANGGDMGDFLKAAPSLMPLLGMLLGGKRIAPPNGVPG